MDETQYIIYEEYSPMKLSGNFDSDSAKETLIYDTSQASVLIPSLYVSSDQNFYNSKPSFVTVPKTLSDKEILSGIEPQSAYYTKITDDYATQKQVINSEIKHTNDSLLHQSAIVHEDSKICEVSDKSGEITSPGLESGVSMHDTCLEPSGIAEYQINLAPLTFPDVVHSQEFLTASGSEVLTECTSESVEINILDENSANPSVDTSSAVPAVCESSRFKKLSSEVVVKLLQDDILKFGTNVVRIIDDIGNEVHRPILQLVEKECKLPRIKTDFNNLKSALTEGFMSEEIEKAILLQNANSKLSFEKCSQCDLSYLSFETLTNHENGECLENLADVNIFDTVNYNHVSSSTSEKNMQAVTSSQNLKNVSNQNHSAIRSEYMYAWNCLVCLQNHWSSSSLEYHYNLHAVQDLSKALMKLTKPQIISHPCNNRESINGKNPITALPESISSIGVEPEVTGSNDAANTDNETKSEIIQHTDNKKDRSSAPLRSSAGDDSSRYKNKDKCNNLNQLTKCSSDRTLPQLPVPDSFGSRPNKIAVKESGIPKVLKRKRKSHSIASGPGSRDPHQCSVCKKVLCSRGNLAKHLIQHQSKKPWLCNTCDTGFNSKRDYDQHNMQRHTNIRPFVCKICGKGYVSSKALDEHTIFHGSDKSFACKLCGKKFRTRKCVRRHTQRHEVTKKFGCEICCKFFRVKVDLVSHIRKIHSYDKAQNQIKESKSNKEDVIHKRKKEDKKVGVTKNLGLLHNLIDNAKYTVTDKHQQTDRLKEVVEFLIPATSTAIMFSELDDEEMQANNEIEKNNIFNNGENIVPISSLLAVTSQSEQSRYIYKTGSHKNKSDSGSSFVIVGVTEDDSVSVPSNQPVSSIELPTVYHQQLGLPSMQRVKHEPASAQLDQMLAAFQDSKSETSVKAETTCMNPEERGSSSTLYPDPANMLASAISKKDSVDGDRVEFYSKDSTVLNQSQLAKLSQETNVEILNPTSITEHSQNVSLDMLSQTLQLEFQNSSEDAAHASLFT